eukprot:1624694-Pyramimonas_sp.AAC.1
MRRRRRNRRSLDLTKKKGLARRIRPTGPPKHLAHAPARGHSDQKPGWSSGPWAARAFCLDARFSALATKVLGPDRWAWASWSPKDGKTFRTVGLFGPSGN